jgi:AbiV family abortive infection protein
MADTKDGFGTVQSAISYGGRLYDSKDDFNAAIDHVARLLKDAVILYERGSYGSAAFLAITALEETSKANVGIYRRDKTDEPVKGRDPFRDHKAKHSMAVLPTVFMTERVVTALGKDRAATLQTEAQEKGFTLAREAALYCARTPSGFVTPKTATPPIQSWEFVVLAIEAADDALVGYTNHSYDVGKAFDALFERMTAQHP